MRRILGSFILLFSFSPIFSQTVIQGNVIDKENRQPLAEAVVSTGRDGRNASTDNQGNFELSLSKKTDSVYISYIGYRTQAVVTGGRSQTIHIALERGPVDLRAVTITPLSNNSSFHTISAIDLNLRPVNSAQDLMRLVPGLFLGQHQGGGIAEHIFFRGFDADHR